MTQGNRSNHTKGIWKDSFWAHVPRGTDDDCWLWIGPRSVDGYGKYSIGYRAHRLAYEFTYGNLPKGFPLLHICDNPLCCNPKHLRPGTREENNRDRDIKGRTARGEKSGRARLTEQDVREIRRRYARKTWGTLKVLINEFGVCEKTILQVVSRKTWKHVL